jgi:hypothetical protein
MSTDPAEPSLLPQDAPFSFDPEGDGFEFHDTADEALSAVEAVVASFSEGLPEDPGSVCWGEVRERMTCVERWSAEDTEDESRAARMRAEGWDFMETWVPADASLAWPDPGEGGGRVTVRRYTARPVLAAEAGPAAEGVLHLFHGVLSRVPGGRRVEVLDPELRTALRHLVPEAAADPDATGFSAPPRRYSAGGRETIDRIRDSMTDAAFAAYCRGTAMKYRSRAGLKGPAAEDLEKARWYEEMESCVLREGPDPRRYRAGFAPYARQE